MIIDKANKKILTCHPIFKEKQVYYSDICNDYFDTYEEAVLAEKLKLDYSKYYLGMFYRIFEKCKIFYFDKTNKNHEYTIFEKLIEKNYNYLKYDYNKRYFKENFDKAKKKFYCLIFFNNDEKNLKIRYYDEIKIQDEIIFIEKELKKLNCS